MKVFEWIFILLFSAACASSYPNLDPTGKYLPEVSGQSLSGQNWTFPKDIKEQKTLMFFAYDQDAQFDVDRWLIGIDQKKYKVNVFEVPTIKGWLPRIVSKQIDAGMRSGIPEDLWKIVVTLYGDAEKVLELTGNENDLNARVVVVDEDGKIVYFHDRGFSVAALNGLSKYFPSSLPSECL